MKISREFDAVSRVLIVRSGPGIGTFDFDRKQPGTKLQMRLPSFFQVTLCSQGELLFVFIVIYLTLHFEKAFYLKYTLEYIFSNFYVY